MTVASPAASGALSTGSWTGPVVDIDVHVAPPTIEVLFPFLADYWLEFIHESNFQAPPSAAQVYPPRAPTSCRPEWRPADGSPAGSSLAMLRSEVLDPLRTERAIVNCYWGVESVRHPDFALALARGSADANELANAGGTGVLLFLLPALIAFVAAGAILVLSYNPELFGGRLHTDVWFALAWGAFPLLTAYFACAEQLRVEALGAAAFAALTSYAQRRLSNPVRRVRRKVTSVSGTIELADGSHEPVTRETLIAGNEAALRAMWAAMVALAVALVVLRS